MSVFAIWGAAALAYLTSAFACGMTDWEDH